MPKGSCRLCPRCLGVRLDLGNLRASSVINSTFLDYCFMIFRASLKQLGETLSLLRVLASHMLAGQCCSQRHPMQPMGCIPHAGRFQMATCSTCCPVASCLCCALMRAIVCWDAARWRDASSFTVFPHSSVMWNCFQISSLDSFVGVF